uniref:Uncharacterized protein n=1 Tax=Nelumbo nucifera TaxID=4432 RepID=A0A822XMI2_NELNU|nr:TPA_asm: hypothetical protein HUJ06_022950 [Nelumbo nucifera]
MFRIFYICLLDGQSVTSSVSTLVPHWVVEKKPTKLIKWWGKKARNQIKPLLTTRGKDSFPVGCT